MALDPKTSREQREAERAANGPEDKPLDPAFPYERIYFDPFHFGVQKETMSRERPSE
jgi:hypothetical protein